ncbi:PREDICTED: BTB/POZ domain-containing protein 2-like isoform X2 [Diuraphis noxia]|uniref:BTB/POZ domain-containing protein 2-like isoform X2 n=1 Tax=Diuraphis noxia TaxID=143948 RepID=UPI00076364BD|nr:PREDICTED: BTB/POZ domain-containing protein 2-like isoform X2 [Diuraphis noxia]
MGLSGTTRRSSSPIAIKEDRGSSLVKNRGSSQKIMYPPNASKDGCRWKNLYNSEAGSDVIFLVGDPECWRFPAHIDVLCQYPVFDAMLREPWSKKGTPIHIPDDDPRAFDNLLKFMYKNTVELKSVVTALETLGLANKYMCVDLVDECIVYLTRNLTVDTVLMVYHAARLYGGQTAPRREQPAACSPAATARATAPPLQDLMPAAVAADDAHSEAFARMVQHYDTLLEYCGAFIDRNADRVMTDESVDELDTVELRELLRRDGLAVSSEMVLFATLERWCTHKCKQQHLELTVANRRAVLDDTVLLSVRYLQMTANEFLSGPMPSGLLNAQETAVLMKHILNPKQPKWTCQRLTKETLEYMSTPRAKRNHGAAGAGGGLSYVIKRRSSSFRGTASDPHRCDGDDSSQSSEFDSPKRSLCCAGGKKNKKNGGTGKKNKKKCMDSCFCNCLIYCLDVCFG